MAVRVLEERFGATVVLVLVCVSSVFLALWVVSLYYCLRHATNWRSGVFWTIDFEFGGKYHFDTPWERGLAFVLAFQNLGVHWGFLVKEALGALKAAVWLPFPGISKAWLDTVVNKNSR